MTSIESSKTDNPWLVPWHAWILLIASIIMMCTNLIEFSVQHNHNSTEHIVTADQHTPIEIDHKGEDTFFVCTAKDDNVDMPDFLKIRHYPKYGQNRDVQNERMIELSPPRPLTLPDWFAKKYQIETKVQCGVSESYLMDAGTILMYPPDNAIVIQAHSDRPSFNPIGLFAVFVLFLIIGIGMRSMNPIRIPKLTYYDGILAFILALGLTYGLSDLTVRAIPKSESLFPGYGEMLSTLAINFGAFLFSALAILFWRAFQNGSLRPALFSSNDEIVAVEFEASNHPVSAKKTDSSPPEELPRTRAWFPILLGFALAILAALSVSLAPMPGLNTAEMASVLISTRYITAHFAILAGISEECLFRGVIQTSFMARPGANHPNLQNAFAILITTVLFALLHVPQSVDHLWALIPITLVSIVSGLLRVRSKSIFQSILLHTTYNTTLLIPSIFMATQVF